MKTSRFLATRAFVLSVALAWLGAACSSKPVPVRPGRMSALALGASPAAYSLFQKELDAITADNDFTRQAKDPNNYDVVVSETADEFVYSFSLRPKEGQRILDDQSVYVVSKKGGVASSLSGL